MFRAIGIGYSRSLTSAAALNWVLKDGLGRLSRCIYTASLASAFDTNLKRVRFSTSLLFTLSIGVELLTPIFPQYFLLLASLANIAKQMSLACYMATSPPIHRSFAIADNLAEVSAKSQIQSVCFDNFGLMLAAVLNLSLKNNQRLQAGLPFIIYPIFSAVDLFGIYQGLKYVHLQTLTKDRIEIIIDTWISFGYVPSPEEVSKDEEINFMWTKGKEPWRIRIGCLNPKGQLPKLSVMAMQSVGKEDYYFICTEIFDQGLTRVREQGILLCVREGARTVDFIMGLLQACYVRKALRSSTCKSMMKANDPSDLVIKEWFKLIDHSRQYVQQDFGPMNEQMVAQGWVIKNILLNTEEQTRYSYMDD
ncbi:Protein root UVB sensitive 4 [Hibiscus syriacus]|uniref:Protein root UVB sensitive 4 n=2 Tax=Hibiscus syriacus TaxID=106335 RepID=A0A6A3B044_HIBSY|nr:Protein root UVB sensitive 4 [Hibiscus syriacus]